MATQKLNITRIYKDMDLAFTANPVTGDLSKKLDVNAVKQSMKILMLTNFYERPFSPKKGANLRGFLFENMTPLTADALATVIENLYKNYEPRTKITSVIVTPDFDQDLYIVDVKFYVIGIDGPQILSTKLERLR
jgi:phage baseplate assembly protein W